MAEPRPLDNLDELADRIDGGMKWRSVWPGIHSTCRPHEPHTEYAERLGATFDAIQTEADVRYRQSLSAVLQQHFKAGTLAALIRRAAERLNEQGDEQ